MITGKQKQSIAIAVVTLAMLSAACGGVQSTAITENPLIQYKPGDVKIQVPPQWQSRLEDGKLILSRSDGSIRVIFFAPAERGMEAGMAEVDKRMSKRKNTGVDLRGKAIGDKMHVQNYYGTGEIDGRSVRWMMTLIDKDTFEEPRLAAVTFGNAQDFENYLPQVLTMMSGLRRI